MAKPFDWKAFNTIIREFVDDHATNTGRAIRAWNLMQDTLGQIFAEIIAPSNHKLAAAIWYSQDNDRAQRKMLKAAAKEFFGENGRLYKELKWICDQADSIGEGRNNVVHVGYSADLDPENDEIVFRPNCQSGRAKTMQGRDIFAELETVEVNCIKLISYTRELSPMVAYPDHVIETWPDRPPLLKRPPKKTPRKKIPLHRKAKRQPPPDS